jgi:hypothetical protein
MKSLIWIGLFAGSTIGSSIPMLWGDSFFSMWSVILSAVGALIGIWAGVKLAKYLGV